jgi:hypothetical protein
MDWVLLFKWSNKTKGWLSASWLKTACKGLT